VKLFSAVISTQAIGIEGSSNSLLPSLHMVELNFTITDNISVSETRKYHFLALLKQNTNI